MSNNFIEKYEFNWTGKSKSIEEAKTSTNKILKPVKEESVNFDTTENLYIEGDNFEVLKILQESYLNKVKMIYIDPPYNTGKNFIYKDNFRVKGDKHSAWLSMMYKRLIVARDLLREDGVIFISIDDNEQANLKRLCDEVFGEENFVGDLPRKTKSMTGDDGSGLNYQHDFLLIFAKNINSLFLKGDEKDSSSYSNPDNDSNGDWVSGNPSAKSGGESTYFEIKNPHTKKIDLPPTGRYWAFSKKTLGDYIKTGRILFKKKHKENERGFIFKRYKNELKEKNNPISSLRFCTNEYLNQVGTRDLRFLFDNDLFQNPKPTNLMNDIINSCVGKTENDIILDFFAGSSTTAHAVMQLNAEDGGNRKFIMVQLPEKTDEKSEAYKAGYKTIADIGKERIRRAGKKIKAELIEKTKQMVLFDSDKNIDPDKLDIGFRVYKTDSSDMENI